MALPDLLWACPVCRQVGGLDPEGRCACGVCFQRGRGASITARWPDGRAEERPAAEWVDRLPSPESLLNDEGREDGGEGVIRQASVIARVVEGFDEVRGASGEFLNRIEHYGAAGPGSLILTSNHVTYAPEGGEARRWPMERLTAVQASSNTLQIKPAGQPLVSFRFTADSIYFWELLLMAAIRDFYRRTGRGEVAEFQPRIVVR